jgi:hypothetical protein
MDVKWIFQGYNYANALATQNHIVLVHFPGTDVFSAEMHARYQSDKTQLKEALPPKNHCSNKSFSNSCPFFLVELWIFSSMLIL